MRNFISDDESAKVSAFLSSSTCIDFNMFAMCLICVAKVIENGGRLSNVLHFSQNSLSQVRVFIPQQQQKKTSYLFFKLKYMSRPLLPLLRPKKAKKG